VQYVHDLLAFSQLERDFAHLAFLPDSSGLEKRYKLVTAAFHNFVLGDRAASFLDADFRWVIESRIVVMRVLQRLATWEPHSEEQVGLSLCEYVHAFWWVGVGVGMGVGGGS
jgi:hypothetical protein